MTRFVGIDVGAETVKLVELRREDSALVWTRRQVVEHHKSPASCLLDTLSAWAWPGVTGAAVSGRLGRQVALPRVPTKQAQASGFRWLFDDAPATIVTIGSHGFQVLELSERSGEILRENSRCAQGTGNFLRQLVERFDLGVEEAAQLAASVDEPAALSGRCPVILKTDMTHLANKGEDRAHILAGLLDAIAENVEVLVKPRVSPPRLVLAGGVARAERVRAHFRRFAERNEMQLVLPKGDDGLYFEALGAALEASQRATRVPSLADLLAAPVEAELEHVPSLAASLSRVRRMPPPRIVEWEGPRDVVLGFDIGSTGSKAVALDLASEEPIWESYLRTNGDPVGAAQALYRNFLESPAALHRVRGLAATGSGREIVGSLLATCYGTESVYVLNEIAAHAAGAVHVDPQVDTIFEIGGQDAKYIRLVDGRVVDAAMNEACSAGTGSFIEEQGKRFRGVESVAELGQRALDAEGGVALGQHCSIFMAEIIDEAIAGGEAQDQIIAGIYDSVISNYVNRVKGSRSVGQRIFCQGMPFASDALAAAVARQTGATVVVPPKPGLMGAIGIALLAADALPVKSTTPIDGRRFLAARVEKKDEMICGATQGCGGAGNKCRIDRLTTVVESKTQRFTWGGGCSLYDKGARSKKLPDLAPDPFRERAGLLDKVIRDVSTSRGRPTVGMTDGLQLKGLFPFFATFIHRLGFDVRVAPDGDRKALKRGIEESSVAFCAPMQQFRGIVAGLADSEPEWLFLPMLRELPRVGGERWSTVCPIVQGAPDMLRWDLGAGAKTRIISPVIDMGHGFLDALVFRDACRALAAELGVAAEETCDAAWREARAVQIGFETDLLALGERALAFCEERGVTPVVVLGRSYTIHDDVLSSNVPNILRAQGAIAVPIDCLPVPAEAPVFEDVFWGYSQRILRAAWHVRRTPGMYGIFCSNYSCGPDSFTVHFLAWLMDGKPFAIIETDGHSGDAGTKTRVEAFLHCVAEDLGGRGGASAVPPMPRDPAGLHVADQTLGEIVARRARLLVPPMGPEAEAMAAAMRGLGVPAEVLPRPSASSLRLGRRHTSGKECLPMTLTFGNLLERVERPGSEREQFLLFMPGSCGPCRFGAYRTLHQLLLERVGHADRVRIWSPPFGDYFSGMPAGFSATVFTGIAALGVLEEMLLDVRPVETRPGAAAEIHARYTRELSVLLERGASGDLSGGRVLLEAASGRAYGVPALLARCANELLAVRGTKQLPSVLLVGEIYVRSDPFANDFVARALEQRGLRVRSEPVSEYLQYSEHVSWLHGERTKVGDTIERWVRSRLLRLCHRAAARVLGWHEPPEIAEALDAASPYMRKELEVETVLTLGVPLVSHHRGEIDAVLSVGPLECMPNKIAEAQLGYVRQEEGLVSLTLSLNGDPIDPEVLDNFAYEVHQRFAAKHAQGHAEARAERDVYAPETHGTRPTHLDRAPPPERRSSLRVSR